MVNKPFSGLTSYPWHPNQGDGTESWQRTSWPTEVLQAQKDEAFMTFWFWGFRPCEIGDDSKYNETGLLTKMQIFEQHHFLKATKK